MEEDDKECPIIRMGVSEWFFWYRPTRVVPDKRPLNGCVCVCVCCLRHSGTTVGRQTYDRTVSGSIPGWALLRHDFVHTHVPLHQAVALNQHSHAHVMLVISPLLAHLARSGAKGGLIKCLCFFFCSLNDSVKPLIWTSTRPIFTQLAGMV